MHSGLLFLIVAAGTLVPAAAADDAFADRCPLRMSGTRRISYDLKLFTHCFKPV